MKRMSIFILVFIFMLALVGCNNNKENNNFVGNAVQPNLSNTPQIESIGSLEIDDLYSDNKNESMKKYIAIVDKAKAMNMTFLEYMDYLGVDVPIMLKEIYSDENYMIAYNDCKEQLSKNEIK